MSCKINQCFGGRKDPEEQSFKIQLILALLLESCNTSHTKYFWVIIDTQTNFAQIK